MRPSLRFLAIAVVGWAGLRAATLGAIPGADVFTLTPARAKAQQIEPTVFPPLEAIDPQFSPPPSAYPAGIAYPPYAPYAQAPLSIRPVMVPVYYAAAPVSRPPRYTEVLPDPAPAFYAPIPPLEQWSLSSIAAASMPAARPTAAGPMEIAASAPAANRLDRVQFTMWALLRGRQAIVAAPSSLATNGTLGASQAGARLTYNFTPQLAASLRTSSDVGRRGGEVAAGVRVRPLVSVPVWITAERRQALGRYGGGRNAFALFAEGGVYQRPLPWQFGLDAYAQAGVVGFHSRDLFADGAFTLTRPVFGQFSAGLGMWGGAQPGLYRIDAGPRLTMKVRRNIRVHLDWRQRLAGNALPDSGPAVTLAGDF